MIRDGSDGVPALLGRLDGHTLLAGGEPYLAVDCAARRCATNIRGTVREERSADESLRGQGHAVCACGVLSEHLPSYRRRRRWHRQHKARVATAEPEPAGQPQPVDPEEIA